VSWVVVGSEPLSSLFFRRPGVYGAGAGGPAAAGASYSYPPPSAVAGHIAGALVRAGLARHPGPVDDGFGDIEAILGEERRVGPRALGRAFYSGETSTMCT